MKGEESHSGYCDITQSFKSLWKTSHRGPRGGGSLASHLVVVMLPGRQLQHHPALVHEGAGDELGVAQERKRVILGQRLLARHLGYENVQEGDPVKQRLYRNTQYWDATALRTSETTVRERFTL